MSAVGGALPVSGGGLLALHSYCCCVACACASVAWDALGSVVSGAVVVVSEVPCLVGRDGLLAACAVDAAFSDDGFPLGALALVR
jgi:hypothetical protein